MSSVCVFNKLRTAFFVQINPADVDAVPGGEEDDVQTIMLPPGPSKIDEDLWEHLKSKPNVQSRIDDNLLVESEPTKSLLTSLIGSVDRSTITALCSKSRKIPDQEVFEAARATSPDGAKREIEDQLEEFKESMPTIGG